jgi:hypothetical protein
MSRSLGPDFEALRTLYQHSDNMPLVDGFSGVIHSCPSIFIRDGGNECRRGRVDSTTAPTTPIGPAPTHRRFRP